METIQDQTVLVIFSEPHAYISPTNYEREPQCTYVESIRRSCVWSRSTHHRLSPGDTNSRTKRSIHMNRIIWINGTDFPKNINQNVKGIVDLKSLIPICRRKRNSVRIRPIKQQRSSIHYPTVRIRMKKMIAEYMAKEKIKNI